MPFKLAFALSQAEKKKKKIIREAEVFTVPSESPKSTTEV